MNTMNPLGTKTPVELPPLPFADTALDPVISANTLSFHYGKHHQAYVNNLIGLIKGTEMEGKCLETIITTAHKDGKTGIFNNAAQTWNHDFYWQSLTPVGQSKMPAALEKQIKASFGGVDALKKEFVAAAMGQFGSGWAWLMWDGEELSFEKTSNAMVPWLNGKKPLLTIDVWEHAYYLDYQNRRQAYAEALLDKIVNWEFALQNMSA